MDWDDLRYFLAVARGHPAGAPNAADGARAMRLMETAFGID